MVLISTLFKDAILNDSSQKIINILAIGFVTLLVLLILNLIKLNKLKSKVKHLEQK